jgi:hypothetical protein
MYMSNALTCTHLLTCDRWRFPFFSRPKSFFLTTTFWSWQFVAILSHDPFQRELDPFPRELVGTVSGGFSTASAPRRQDPRPS